MRKQPIIENISLNPLGEIRMGAEAYGVVIKTNFGVFDCFKEQPVFIGSTDYSSRLTQSKCERYMLLKTSFGTYILDIKSLAVSVYRTTIRTAAGGWSEEQAIFGKERTHISGFDRHYYLQFPFVKQDEFNAFFCVYESLRQQQIEALVNH